MPLEGQQLGRYRLVSLLGSGGMGEVYLAEDTGIARQVAIKVIRSDVALRAGTDAASDAVRRFQREMQTIARLNHPYILPLFDYGEGTMSGLLLPYMVMPYGRDGSLATWLKQRSNAPSLAPSDVAHIIQQAADALQYAHDQQIIHRDVKPSNFLIRVQKDNPNRPDVLLADFGLARLSDSSSSVSLTVAGSPLYMSPEQWRGHPVPATDQYMLAAMAYELLTGRPPFRGTLEQLMYQHLQEQPELPSRFNPQVPAALDAVLRRALAKQPEARYPSISAFARAFQDALQPAGSQINDSYATIDSFDMQSGNRVDFPTLSADKQHPSLPPVTSTPAPVQPFSQYGGQSQAAGKGRGFNLNVAASRNGLRCSVTFLAILVVALGVSSLPFLLSLNHPASSGTGISPPTAHTATVAPGSGHTPAATPTPEINASATAAAGATQNPYPPYSGTLALNDPLQNNNNGYNWGVDNNIGSCKFIDGAYHVIMPQTGQFHYCTASATSFTDFVYQLQMTITRGDQGGILFRANGGQGNFYYFHISRKGLYGLDIYNNRTFVRTLHGGFSAAINTALNAPNLLAIVAKGNTFDLYINLQHVASASDNTFSNGQIGVAADDEGDVTEVVFRLAKVWTF